MRSCCLGLLCAVFSALAVAAPISDEDLVALKDAGLALLERDFVTVVKNTNGECLFEGTEREAEFLKKHLAAHGLPFRVSNEKTVRADAANPELSGGWIADSESAVRMKVLLEKRKGKRKIVKNDLVSIS